MRILIAFLFTFLVSTGFAARTNFYVAPYGNNSNDGLLTNAANAWLTIQYGLDHVGAGNTLNVLNGTYSEGGLTAPASGSSFPGGLTIIQNYTGHTPTNKPPSGSVQGWSLVSASYVMVSGITVDCTSMDEPNASTAFKMTWCNFCIVTNCNIFGERDNDMHGLQISNGGDETKQSGSNVVINTSISRFGDGTQQGQNGIYCQASSNLFYGVSSFSNNNFGIKVGAADTVGNRILKGKWYKNGEAGIETDQCGDTWIENNLVWSNTSFGIKLGYRSAEFGQVHIDNNTVPAGGAGASVFVQANSSGSSNIYILNNIAANATGASEGYGFWIQDVPATVYLSNNLAYANTKGNYQNDNGSGTVESGNLFGNQYDAAFVDAANTNYAIGSTSSARNNGVTVSSVTDDVLSLSRPQESVYDIGAYEYNAGGQLPLVTVNATDSVATEGPLTTGTFTISRTGSTAAGLTVVFSVSGTATSGVDYTSLGTSILIPAGSSTVDTNVVVIQDALVEPDETVILTVSADAAYTVGSPSSATVTIVSDDILTDPRSVPAPGTTFPLGDYITNQFNTVEVQLALLKKELTNTNAQLLWISNKLARMR